AWVQRNPRGTLVSLWMISVLAVACAGFLASGWRGGNTELLMNVSLTRLLMHGAPLLALLLIPSSRHTE
ncbi:MAG: hypothetical protein MK213_07850, partial [Planctomycetes bacterium]|nr:hypothetical protein [Planctomycetota bacterium]